MVSAGFKLGAVMSDHVVATDFCPGSAEEGKEGVCFGCPLTRSANMLCFYIMHYAGYDAL